jgi:hypothetical protein
MSETITITHADRMMTHKQMQSGLEELAHTLGYKIAHFRPAMRRDGSWVTPVSGDGKGWLDDILAKEGMPLVIIELKTEGDTLTPEQKMWFNLLNLVPGIRVLVVYPHDCWELVTRILTGKRLKPLKQSAKFRAFWLDMAQGQS